MATYNWNYRPGVPNKYNVDIADSAEDIRPSNACYVALFGNDDMGNGSRLKPFRTLKYSIQNITSTNFILSSGVYREVTEADFEGAIIGDGDVVIDFSYFDGARLFEFSGRFELCNLKIIGNGLELTAYNYQFTGRFFDCIFDNVIPVATCDNQPDKCNIGILKNCIIKNCKQSFALGDPSVTHSYNENSYSVNKHINLTIVNCSNFVLSSGFFDSIVIRNSNVTFSYQFDYTPFTSSILFSQCNFRFYSGGNKNLKGLALYPQIPAKFEYIDDINVLRDKYIQYYPTVDQPLIRCEIGDPEFNNEIIGDYSLGFDSPAKNMSYFGTYIGAQSIGYSIKANAAGGDFDLSTNTNLIFSENSIVLANPALEASIESNVIPNLIARELSTAPVYGFYADRNGLYLDTIGDLSTVTVSAATNLIANTPYLVEDAAITYNGAVIQTGERFTTTSVLSFSSAGNGVCREILEAPQRHTILARFSSGGTVLPSGTTLTIGYWYYASGIVNYEGVTYTNQVFKATATSSFNGSGNVVLAMSNEAYQHYEPGIKLTSNNVADIRTGEIIRGNGDPLYERGLGKEFPINARFIQFRCIIKVNNLKP